MVPNQVPKARMCVVAAAVLDSCAMGNREDAPASVTAPSNAAERKRGELCRRLGVQLVGSQSGRELTILSLFLLLLLLVVVVPVLSVSAGTAEDEVLSEEVTMVNGMICGKERVLVLAAVTRKEWMGWNAQTVGVVDVVKMAAAIKTMMDGNERDCFIVSDGVAFVGALLLVVVVVDAVAVGGAVAVAAVVVTDAVTLVVVLVLGSIC